MGELSEFWNEIKQNQKFKREEKAKIFEPMLISAGATETSYKVYMLGDWLCYPTKGFCMHKKTRKKQSIEKTIREETINRVFKNGLKQVIKLDCKTNMRQINETDKEYKKRLISEVENE